MAKQKIYSFLTPRKILMLCVVAIIVTTFMSMRMVTENTSNNEDFKRRLEQRGGDHDDTPNTGDMFNQPKNNDIDNKEYLDDERNIKAGSNDIVIKKKTDEQMNNFFNKYQLPFRNPTKPMTEEEQYEANRLKALRSKDNDEERLVLLKKVFDEVDREKEMLASMPITDVPDYVAIPRLPDNYVPLTIDLSSDAGKAMLADPSWKLDPLRNPFLLPKPHLFIHVPKTGGSSLGNIFKRNERRDQFNHFWAHPGKHELEDMATRLKTIFGHVRYGLHFYYDQYKTAEDVPVRADGLNRYSYMTMLREPIDRVISHYYYHRQNKRDPGHQLAMRYSLKEWIRISPAANNEQARMLCGVAHHNYEGNETRTEECAIHHMKYTYKFVGLTEKFSESLVLLSHYGGFQAIRFTKINSGTQRVSVNDVPKDIVDEIIQRNQADIILYGRAKDIFEKQIDAIGRQFVEYETKEFKKKIRIF